MLASKAAWLVGLIDIAIEHGERWHSIARQAGRPEDEVGALIHLARLYYEAEDRERQWEAVEWSDRALELSEEIGFRPARVTALVNKGSALIEQPGRREDGIELLERSIAEAEAAGYDLLLYRALHNLLWGTLGEWPPERSRQMLRTLHDLSERNGRGGALGKLHLLAMEIATVEGDLATARAALEEERAVAELSQPAADEIRAGERPLAPARRHLEAALLEAEGNRPAALDAYLEAGGAEGQRTVPRRGAGPLTPREREVAQLVAEGLSNGEVAKRLFISTKTASVHVSNILGKLGMSSRAEIAAWAVGTGLAMVGQGQR